MWSELTAAEQEEWRLKAEIQPQPRGKARRRAKREVPDLIRAAMEQFNDELEEEPSKQARFEAEL
jgi:hypothetical protein